MNKTELITLLRDPNAISSANLDEIVELVDESPYFLSARLLLAKGSKELKLPETKKRIASAAVYSTDRVLLKKYLSGDLFFLSQPPSTEKVERKKVVTKSDSSAPPETRVSETKKPEEKPERRDKRPSTLKESPKKPTPSVPSVPAGDLDEILEELKQDMQNLKSSRAHFVEVQDKIEEEGNKADAKETEAEPPKDVKEEAAPEIAEAPAEKKEVAEAKDIEIEDLKKDIEKEVTAFEESKPIKARKVKRVSRKKVSKKKETEIDEDEVVNKKLAELAKQQEEIAAKVDKEIKQEKENKAKKEELAKEKAKEEKAAADKKEKTKEEKKEKVPAKIKVAKAKKEETAKAKKSAEKKEAEDKKEADSEERAEKSIREPRFSRDSTRSYLRTLEVPDDDFIDFGSDDDEEEKQVVAEDTPESKAEEAKKEETDIPKVEEKEEAKTKAPKEEKSKEAKKEKEEEKPAKTAAKKKEVSKADSAESAMPKTTIVKKAKLVKRKRSTRQSGGAGKSAAPKLPKSKDDDDGKGDREKQKDIIEKFIKESPSIKYSKEAEPSTADLAENSTSWDKNLASEYLAEIYLKQGNKKRTVEIYEALALKYPEKKSYFADLISKIK